MTIAATIAFAVVMLSGLTVFFFKLHEQLKRDLPREELWALSSAQIAPQPRHRLLEFVLLVSPRKSRNKAAIHLLKFVAAPK